MSISYDYKSYEKCEWSYILLGNLNVVGRSAQCSHMEAKQKRVTFIVFYLQNIN